VATALQADVAAVAVPSPDEAGEISLSAVYDRAAQAYLPARSFPLDEVTPLRSAIHRRRPLMLEPGHDDRALNRLLEHMSSAGTGLLLIQPMIHGENALGAILVGNPRTNRPLTDQDRALAGALAERAALALTLAQQHEDVAGRAEQLSQIVRERDVSTGPLAQQLKDAQAESRHFAQRLTELQAQLDHERENARHLARVVAADGRAPAVSALPAGDLDDAMRALGERESEIARLLAAIAEQAEKMAALDKELADVGEVARTLAHELDDAQAQIAKLKDPGEFQQLNDQLARTQLELVEARSAIDELTRDELRLLSPQHPAAQAEGATSQPDTEVLNAVVQELRTPMTSLLGYTDLLLDESVGILGAMQRKFLQRIKTNVERMRGIMDDLIRLTAIETGQLRLEPQPVDLTEVIAEAVSRSSGQFREKGITLKVALAPGLPVIKADRDALYQVFVQLLHNAALCSRVDGEVVLEMRRETMPDDGQAAQTGGNGDVAGGHILVALRDSGGGIAPEDRPRVFNRIYRADNPLIPGVGDTGVGLSIAKVLVEAQGGRIWVDSVIGSGSIFNVLLPLPGANGNGPKA
jgi:signal transduction histidine kinase